MMKVKSRSMILPAAMMVALASPGARSSEATASPAVAPPHASLADALTGGKAHLEFRYRLETVEQVPFAEDAIASTLRTRLNYQTGEWHHLSAFVEADNLTVLGDDAA